MEQKITIGNVCFVKDDHHKKVLFLKRKNQPMQGMCTGVGGKTKFDEDISASCVREVKEETGLDVDNIRLKGVVKTVLEGKNSSWILFVYTASQFKGELAQCDEGELSWIHFDEMYSQNLIGFIRRILPFVMEDCGFVEGTIVHDLSGNIVNEKIKLIK